MKPSDFSHSERRPNRPSDFSYSERRPYRPSDFHNDILPLKDKIFRLALRITCDRPESEDITQETLIRLWQQRNQWHAIDNIEAYSLTIARRLALDYLKSARNKVLPYGESPALSPSRLPDEALDQKQRADAIRRIIDSLPEAQRTVIQLRDIEGMSYDEISQITSLSETQVKVYLHRARTKIKQALLKKMSI